ASAPGPRRSPRGTGRRSGGGAYRVCPAVGFAKFRRLSESWQDSFGRVVELLLRGVEALLPGSFKFFDAFVFQHQAHIGQIDADGLELVEDPLGGRRGA